MEKRGVSEIKGKTEIRLGEEVFYEITKHYEENYDNVKKALWKLYIRESGKWRELRQNPSSPPKRGDKVSYIIRNQKLLGKTLMVEAYIYKPEVKSPPGLIVKVLAGEEKKIHSVELFKADDSPITKSTVLEYNQTIKVKVYTQNMPEEFLKLTLYEDDVKGEEHSFKNNKNKVAEITKRTNKNGFLVHEFKLNADFSKIANAILDGPSDKHHEYYIVVESAEYGSKASRNVNVENPEYRKIYDGSFIKEVVLIGKYKKQMGIDPKSKTGKSTSKVGEEKKEGGKLNKKKEKGKWHNPVDNPRLTKYGYSGILKPSSATYGWCRRKSDGSKKYHSGLDLFAIPGKDKVYSCLKGNIYEVKYSNSAGWIVRVKIQNVQDLLEQEEKVAYKTQFTDELKGIDIKETDSVYLIYMHLHSVFFTSEDAKNRKEIEAGTPLGYAGVSGSIANGGKTPHLHFEVATVLNPYGKGETARTNPARFIKLNSYNTKDQDEAVKNKYYHEEK